MSLRNETSRGGVDATALVHALELHEAELEMQNRVLAETNADLLRANAALEAAHDRFRALYDLAPAPLITVDADGTIVEINAAAEALLAARRPHLIDRRLAVFVAEESRPALRALLRELFARGAVRGGALVLAPAGAAIDVQVEAVAVGTGDGGDPREHAVLACMDVTAHRRALERQRLESLGVLAAGVAHDFNNLLTVVLAGADHALRTLGPAAPEAASLVEVTRAARLAGGLAHQMLAYSGRISAPPRVIDLGAMVHDLEPLLRASAEASPLVLDLSRALPAIRGDETQLRQVVLNLVINAGEAMRGRPGAIAIAARAQTVSAEAIARMPAAGELEAGACVVLEVHDDGAGMDAATQARIFEPYFSTKSTGRGLGLATVQGILRAHHAAITVESALGAGTTFRVYLPAVAETKARAPTESGEWRGSGTVLLVDDEDLVRNAMARILADFGLTVVVAGDGVAAIEAFRADPNGIDLVLTDLTMPRMGGVAAATAIHAVRADVPIVLVTGYGEVPASAAGLFADVLPKPFDIEAMRRVLERVLPADRAAMMPS